METKNEKITTGHEAIGEAARKLKAEGESSAKPQAKTTITETPGATLARLSSQHKNIIENTQKNIDDLVLDTELKINMVHDLEKQIAQNTLTIRGLSAIINSSEAFCDVSKRVKT